MRLTIDLSTDESIALRRFANLHYDLTVEEVAARAIREYLIGTGDLDPKPQIDEDSQTAGEA